jgi:hypothetical protein
VEFDENGEMIRPLERLGFDPPARANGFALLSNGALLIAVTHRASRRGPHRFGLYVLRDTGGRVEIRHVTGIGPAEGFFVAGVHRGEVGLFTSHSIFFVPESAL